MHPPIMFPLFSENRKSLSHNFSVVKKLKKKCNLPDFKFHLGKIANKNIPHMLLR